MPGPASTPPVRSASVPARPRCVIKCVPRRNTGSDSFELNLSSLCWSEVQRLAILDPLGLWVETENTDD
eukprot:2944424-Rhodomonas_salina.1